MKITILGAGNMGTALATTLNEKKYEVILWSIEEDVVIDINNNNLNSKYLPNIKLNENIKATLDLKYALIKSDIAVFSVPSNILRSVAEQTKNLISKNTIIMELSKGIEEKSNKRMSEILEEYFDNPIVCVGGPSIANELAKKIPTFVIYASKDKKALDLCKEVFSTDYYHINTSDDVVGVELGGTLKNIIAIIAGISDGLGYGVNTKAGIISNGLEELSRVCKIMGGKEKSMYSLAGLGDLVVTCMSEDSRNRKFGEAIGRGQNKEEAKKDIYQVVEGEKAIKIIYNLIKDKKEDFPLLEKVYRIVVLGEEPKI